MVSLGGRLLRLVNESGRADVQAFLRSAGGRSLLSSGRVAATRVLDPSDISVQFDLPDPVLPVMVLEHDRIWFPSFPYEWPAEMLHQAGVLTLDIAEQLLPEGLSLKDATPYNVLYRGPQPVFIDLLSFDQRDPTDQTWLPYAQFLRTFVLPLLVNRHFGLPLKQILESSRDGLEPRDVYAMSGPLKRLRPPFLTLVSLPSWLGGWRRGYDPTVYRRASIAPARARFVLEHLFRHLRRLLRRVAPKHTESEWSGYDTDAARERDQLAAKRRLIEDLVQQHRPSTVLDVGCNTGYMAAIAARAGASVVAIDSDPVMVGETWRRAVAENLDILPLVVDLTRPSPAIGWRNRECPSFLTRANGAFDAVFMLAVIHHMLVSERIPLPEILDLAAELTRDLAVIEYVGPQDSLFQRLARGRDDLFREVTTEAFEEACKRQFHIVNSVPVSPGSRQIYVLKKRSGLA